MTQNQLKYWELRWKQYYEFHYLQETKRSNLAKEAETRRHNLATERISKQEIVLRRIELSQSQERINLEWQKLSETQRSNLVHEGLESVKLLQQQVSLTQKEKQLAMEYQKLMSDVKLATAELISTITHQMNEDTTKYITANAKAFGAGWAKGGVTEALAYIQSIPGIKNYQNIIHDLEKGLNESMPDLNIEVSPLQTPIGSKDESKGDYQAFRTAVAEHDKKLTEIYGPDAINRSINRAKESVSTGPGINSETPRDKQGKTVSGVIISPGAQANMNRPTPLGVTQS